MYDPFNMSLRFSEINAEIEALRARVAGLESRLQGYDRAKTDAALDWDEQAHQRRLHGERIAGQSGQVLKDFVRNSVESG